MDEWTLEHAAKRIAGYPDGHAPTLPDEIRQVEEIQQSLQRHLDGGKGLVYFENQDLGHRDLGTVLGFTYGTPEAQFEGGVESLPKFCPDGLAVEITCGVNYRYTLVAVTPAKAG